MKITWLGQAGLLFEINEKKIIIDPYLSNSVEKQQPQNYRRQPIDERFLRIKPDIIIITHNHADHLDKETLCHYINEESEITVLAPNGAWQELRRFGGSKNNYVLFNNGTTWTESFASFRAVKAEHSDEYAIGVIIQAEEKRYYVTGDTLYSERVFESLINAPIDYLFLPINGKGNNMNILDAERFAKRINAKCNVPTHFGLFDEICPADITLKNKKILPLYVEVFLDETSVKPRNIK